MNGYGTSAGISTKIAGMGMCVPDQVLSSADLSQRLNLPEDWIPSHVGIRERHLAAAGQGTADIAAVAAERALADAKVSASEVDLVIVATESPERPIPSTACILQDRLHLARAAAFDLNAACSGFVYALTVGSQFIATGTYRNILVIGADVVSPNVNWEDPATCILIGDGAGAVVLQPAEAGQGILAWKLGADGSGGDHLTIPAGGSQLPITHQLIDEKQHFVQMNGQEISLFALRTVPAVTRQALALAGLSVSDISLFIPHQANGHILEVVARRLELPPEKVVINVDRFGNTVAASIPIALCEARESGRIKPGDIVVLTGFGAGLTWGSVVLRWV